MASLVVKEVTWTSSPIYSFSVSWGLLLFGVLAHFLSLSKVCFALGLRFL